MSRRDWFRLRKPNAETLPAAISKTENAPAGDVLVNSKLTHNDRLRPIDLPPNHDGMDLAQLPPMREALLTSDEVDALIMDLESNATNIQLFQKDAQSKTGQSSGTNSHAVRLARVALFEGRTRRLQIRYSWNEADWIDTLEARPNGFRLVRIEHRR